MTELGDPTMVNGFDDTHLDELPADLKAAVQRRNRVLGPVYRLFYEEPVEIVRGHGTYVYDSAGTEYLDAYNNVPCVGHAHPRVVEAIARQAGTVNTNTRYLQPVVVDYAEDLLSTFPAPLRNIVFTCSGSEANDLALRVVRYVTGKQGIIVTANAYHGLTSAVAGISPSLGANSALDPAVRTIAAPDERLAAGSLGDYLRAEIASATADLERHGFGLAAFIADSIFSSDGVFTEPAGFLGPVLDEVHRAGGIYIADEVQPGFGRTGDSWWGFQRHGVVPDIVTIGKPMGNGMPIAAAVFDPGLLADFGHKVRYFNTFGGNTVSIAAAQAVLDVIRDEALIDNAAQTGARLKAGIEAVTAEHDGVTAVRGRGLFIGVEMMRDAGDGPAPDAAAATAVVNELRRRKVLISASGPHGNVLKIRPPLAFRAADADRFLTEFAAVLAR